MSQIFSASHRYLVSANELNLKCTSRPPDDKELHDMIMKAGVALKELVYQSERLEEEIWGRAHPRDLHPPQPKQSHATERSKDFFTEYIKYPYPANIQEVFKTINSSIVEMVGLVTMKKRILWDPPSPEQYRPEDPYARR